MTSQENTPSTFLQESGQNPQYLERLKPVLLEHRLYLPSLDQLNDPADGRPKLVILDPEQMVSFLVAAMVRDNPATGEADQQRHAMILRHSLRVHGMDFFHSEFVKLLHRDLESFRVYSMSKRWDNLALWAKYAGDHTGYCLEFANTGELFKHAKEVIYGESVPMDVTNPAHRSGYFLFMKRPEWSNEEEIRLVRPRTKNNVPGVIIRPEWMTRIILGKNISEENERQIREWSLERSPALGVVKAQFDQAPRGEKVVRCPSPLSHSLHSHRIILVESD